MNSKRNLFILFATLCVAQILAACGTAATPMAEPTAVPPPAATATPEPADPAEIVQGFWDAMEAGDVAGAMLFVASDATCRGSCYFAGEQSFRSYLQGIVDSGATTRISDLQIEGDTVTYSWEMFRNGNLQQAGEESMQVQDGKIIHWENLHI